MSDIKAGTLYLGSQTKAEEASAPNKVLYDAKDLTTHGVIVGMTGSGKTGLGVIFLEEALLSGIPCLILDPKGDMTNLMLNFPELQPSDFEPWVNPRDADRKGLSVSELAAQTAEMWKNGLAGSDIPPSRMKKLESDSRVTIFTPGSSAGVPLNVLGSLTAPQASDAETMRDEIEGFVSSLLGLAGIKADPIASREHILLSNIIENAWSKGQDLDLAQLIGQVHKPPMRKLGVFDLDSFFPEKDRLGLAMRLNGLVASPAFAEWISGMPLDIDSLLFGEGGKPRGSIIYLAHLSEEERQFTVTLLLSKVVTWMRQQKGSSDLRALIYMDEVFGFAPPSANPPAKKAILTILKQARAYGLGMLLSTQNPVDLDYKAMSNAGTWCIGRLQTERDKARILEGLSSSSGDLDTEEMGRSIGELAKRQFILHNTRDSEPQHFSTRWAISYLRGPMTRREIGELTSDAPERQVSAASGPSEASAPATSAESTQGSSSGQDPNALPGEARLSPRRASSAQTSAPELAEDESSVAPDVAKSIPVRFLNPSAPWAEKIGADPRSQRLEAALVARVRMVFDETKAKLNHRDEWEAIVHPLPAFFDAETALQIDYDDRDFDKEGPANAAYALPEADVSKVSYFRGAQSAIKDHLYRQQELTLWHNPHLKLYSRPGESEEAFRKRCVQAAEDAADAEMAKIRDRMEKKLDRVQASLRSAQQRAAELEVDLDSRKNQELMAGAGALIGALLGGRSSSSKIASAARQMRGVSSRRSQTRRTAERVETAHDKIEDKVVEIERLEADLAEELGEIGDRWDDQAGEISTLEVGLEKNDIDVEEVALVWMPMRAS